MTVTRMDSGRNQPPVRLVVPQTRMDSGRNQPTNLFAQKEFAKREIARPAGTLFPPVQKTIGFLNTRRLVGWYLGHSKPHQRLITETTNLTLGWLQPLPERSEVGISQKKTFYRYLKKRCKPAPKQQQRATPWEV